MKFSSMKSVRKFAAVAAALMVLPVAVACQSEPDMAEPVDTNAEMNEEAGADPEEGATIVDVASANGSFNTLVAAIGAADLADTLSDEGPYTVFAPTDDAFAALPDGILDALLLEENEDALASILKYHVVSGAVASSAIEPGMVESLEGEDLDISVDGGTVMVSGATVTQADVPASNGVIHVIDTVLLPPSLDLEVLSE